MEYGDLEISQVSVNEYLTSNILFCDLMMKSYEMIEKTQAHELYNSAWGWHGANLDD